VLSTFLTSAGLVAVAEIGDKTQLLSMVLSAQFRRPLPIVAGILAATAVNHAVAAAAGAAFAELMQGAWMSALVGASFLAIAAWALSPDRIEGDCAPPLRKAGPFVAALICFFLAEIGDKTQIATVALAAKERSVLTVTAGTTLGMMIANVPAVLVGSALATRLPLRTIRISAAALFATIGILILSRLLLS
jgi:Ca2+/H+ antiporter, TMEM165/GDT1 family